MNCPFCNSNEIIASNSQAYALYDRHPVNPGHILIVTKRHVADFFDTTIEEKEAINELIQECKTRLDQEYSPDGYNIGINCGQPAGQTVFHVHVHLIPRYKGDIENPKGGVRGFLLLKGVKETEKVAI